MIGIEKARAAVWEAAVLDLYGSTWFAWLEIEAVAKACNGCGPEWLAPTVRGALTKWLDVFFPAFCIHDCRFTFCNDGSRERFDDANEELRKNCLLLANDAFVWCDIRRYIWRHRAKVIFAFCRDFGWSAWRDAYVEKQKEMK